jgi:hypothetical protein
MGERFDPRHGRAPMSEPAADPLWGLTCVLGDIAARIERQRASEQTEDTPETRRRAGSDPTARREVP